MHPSLIIFEVEVDDFEVDDVDERVDEDRVEEESVDDERVEEDRVEEESVDDERVEEEIVDDDDVREVARVAIDTLVLTVEIVYSCLIVVDELVPRLAVRVELPEMSRVVLCGALGGKEELPVLLQLLKEYP